MSTNGIDLSILTQRIECSETDTTKTTTIITGDDDIDQKINNYFKRKKTDTASNPTDTLAEVFAKYDKNHDGKISKDEVTEDGVVIMDKSTRKAFNNAMKAFGGDDGKIKSKALKEGSGTMYTKDGKSLFSIQQDNEGNTVTKLYNNDKVTSIITENQNWTKTEENFNTDGNAQKITLKYTDTYSTSQNGITESIYENAEPYASKITTCYGDNNKVVLCINNGEKVTTYEGELPEGVQEKSGDKIVRKKQESSDGNKTTLTFEDGTQQETIIQEDGQKKTVTMKNADGNITETKEYQKSDDGQWVEIQGDVTDEHDPVEESPEQNILETLKTGFGEGNTIEGVTIQGGQTKLSSGDYTGTISLPTGQNFQEGNMPETLYMSLPEGINGKMKLTLDNSTGLYTTTRGDRQFKITVNEGKITMEAVTNNQEVNKQLATHLDEYKTKIDLSKSHTARNRQVNAYLSYDSTSSWANANLDDSTKSKVQQYFDLSSVCLADAANMDQNQITKEISTGLKSIFAKLPDGRWITAYYNNDGSLENIHVSFNNAKNYNVGENKRDLNETIFDAHHAYAYLAHNSGETDYSISGDAYSFDNIKAVALKIFPETWPES